MTENDVRLVVADRLLEPGGLQLGLITNDQFHAYFLDALADFCRSTGIVKLFSTQTVNNGQSKYVFPDRLINVESVFTSGRFVPRSNLNSIDNSQFKWRNKVGPVKAFHEDGLPVKTIEAVPAPDWQGTLVTDPSGYEYLDAFSAPGTIPAAERNLTVYGSQIPTGLTVCEPSVSALTLEHTSTIPPAYFGWDFNGNLTSPAGQFVFEYGGFQYAFLCEGGAGPLAFPLTSGYQKVHALRSADNGLTWVEMDAANAPVPGTDTSRAGYTAARDGSKVVLIWVRIHGPQNAPIVDGITAITFNLATGLWGTPVNYTAPALDALASSWFFLQLAVRGSGDYVLYYSGPRETIGFSHFMRAYYATFDGTTFGTGTILPNQSGVSSHGLPLSVCVDSSGMTHFLIQLQFGGSGFGVDDCHVALSHGNAFGSMQLVTGDDPQTSSSSGGSSQLIVIPGAPERIAFVTNVVDAGNLYYLKMFVAPSGTATPVWSASLITGNQDLKIYPDNTNLIPQGVTLGVAGGLLVAVWGVSDNFSDSGTFSWYWSQADATALTWSAPAVLAGQPDFTGEGPFGGSHAHATQVCAYTLTGGIGIVTVWSGERDDLVAQFSHLVLHSTIGHCTQMIPDSAILYLGFGVLAKVFMDSSELKDQQKALYATSRYQEGVGLFRAMMLEEIEDQQE